MKRAWLILFIFVCSALTAESSLESYQKKYQSGIETRNTTFKGSCEALYKKAYTSLVKIEDVYKKAGNLKAVVAVRGLLQRALGNEGVLMESSIKKFASADKVLDALKRDIATASKSHQTALSKYHQAYIEALDKKIKVLTKSDKINEALVFQEELDSMRANAGIVQEALIKSNFKHIEGLFIRKKIMLKFPNNNKGYWVVLQGDGKGMIARKGKSWTVNWNIKGNKLIILASHDYQYHISSEQLEKATSSNAEGIHIHPNGFQEAMNVRISRVENAAPLLNMVGIWDLKVFGRNVPYWIIIRVDGTYTFARKGKSWEGKWSIKNGQFEGNNTTNSEIFRIPLVQEGEVLKGALSSNRKALFTRRVSKADYFIGDWTSVTWPGLVLTVSKDKGVYKLYHSKIKHFTSSSKVIGDKLVLEWGKAVIVLRRTETGATYTQWSAAYNGSIPTTKPGRWNEIEMTSRRK